MEKFYIFSISFVVFLVVNSGGVFRLSVSSNAKFFMQSRLHVSMGFSLHLVEIYKLYVLDLTFM